MEKVHHLKIPFEEIKFATNNFSDENFIGRGGFGNVYKGNLTVSGQLRTVAVKRLDHTGGQGEREFLTEIQMLSCYRHENVISLIGFCRESEENILVYEHAKYGSLDRYLDNDNLSWTQRLKISLGAARGFNYLHYDVGPQHRVLHRDIKSFNILLNENWEAKISDFGLSKIGPSNVEFTFLVTNACGTYGYIDPQYRETGILTKESDVYSFGVVLFEILCGRVALVNTYQDERRFLDSLAQRCYEQNKLDEIILPSIKNDIKGDSLNIFSTIAYECLKAKRDERPSMFQIMETLEEALRHQEPTGFDNKADRPQFHHEEENVDALIKCVSKSLGFSQGKPVAAFTIYKCLVHWKSFEAERTSVFHRLIQIIDGVLKDTDNHGYLLQAANNHEHYLAYWLSNASTLLFLLQRSIKFGGRSSSLLSSRMTRNSVVAASELEIVPQFEAKYPVLLFKQQLIARVEKMYLIICENLKKMMTSFLTICIQAPSASKGVLQYNHWQGIIYFLNTQLNTLKENFVPPFIIRKIFPQIFSYINVQLFNSLLLRRECCTLSHGEYVKVGLAELLTWCSEIPEEYVGVSQFELNHIEQAARFLVIHNKYRFSFDELTNDICPCLTIEQLYRICTLYSDEKYNIQSVSPDVISSMRRLISEDSNNAASNSILLEDDSSIPFSVHDLSLAMRVNEFIDVKPAVELAEIPAFQFLFM